MEPQGGGWRIDHTLGKEEYAIATYATNEPQYATRSLLSRSRVDWAIEAARRVRAEPVGALGEAGLRGSAGAPTDASSKRPASSEGDRRAEEGSTALRGPARLVEQPVRHRPRHPGSDLPDEGLCLGAQGAADADDKGEKPQTGCAWLVGWHGILAW